ncbi:hypothetical protein GYMLUDRAFT_71617 [Collybiopsis luxurians FD-317 M1]|uniref:Uncharacterized protein n=1 Tax=Collybiopsis luxurians FD-317 M1 TaxID=944289 RepID=A0A0D0D4A8_9AGAR|nr:hypothetical protein GYMLUDRAFT_71617 [Collybiopsis luxurians FD-317 M1]
MTPMFNTNRWKGVMALVDADAGVNPPLQILWTISTRITLVFTTSPQLARYKEWRKQRSIDTFIPDPPSIEEAIQVWKLYNTDDAAGSVYSLQKVLLDAWKDYGPDLRLGTDILKFGAGHVADHRAAVVDAVNSLNAGTVTQLTSGQSELAISHTVVETIRRTIGGRQSVVSRVRSQAVMRLLIAHYTKESLAERRRLFYALSGDSRFGTSLGWLFESMAIDKLSHGVSNLKILPLTSKLKKTSLKWSKLAIDVFPRLTNATFTKSPESFYVPAEGNNKTWDAYCLTKKGNKIYGYGFQMTVGRKRKLNAEGLATLAKRFTAARVNPEKYFFIFVTPVKYEFKLPTNISATNLRKWKFYHLPLEVTDSDPEGKLLLAKLQQYGGIDKDDSSDDEESDESNEDDGTEDDDSE